MNTILTDDEIIDVIRKAGLRVIGPHKSLSRAVEAAVLAKLAQQADLPPVIAELHCLCGAEWGWANRQWELRESPQQADRQRVPANKANNEFNRVIQHAITLGSEADPFLRCWNEGNWDECREFDFEPALPYEIEEQADRQRVPDGYVLVSKDRLKALSASIHGDCYMGEEWEKEAVAAMLAAAPEAPAQFDWSKFPGYLIDRYEGETLTEELLQRAAAELAAPEAPAQALPVGYLREFIGKGAAIVRRFYNLEDQSVVEAGSWMQEAMQLLQLKAAPEAPAQADDDHLEQHLEMAPAQASAVDEREAFDRALSTKPEARFWNATDAMFWAWQARAALAQKGGAA